MARGACPGQEAGSDVSGGRGGGVRGRAAISLAVSWLLVSRLERIAERLGLSEALLGLVAALAADAPEVTAAVTAMAATSSGSAPGSSSGPTCSTRPPCWDWARLPRGASACTTGSWSWAGAVAMWVAAVCLAVVLGLVPPVAGVRRRSAVRDSAERRGGSGMASAAPEVDHLAAVGGGRRGTGTRRGDPAAAGGSRAWGICTECGMGRAGRGEIPGLLDLHRDIVAAG